MSNTTNLNLFKHDNPSTNTNPFNIESALNGNWDKIDTYAGNTNTAITNSENSIEALQQENQRLKETLPTTTGSGENITLNKTAELDFVVPPLPRGNTVQDGEPTPSAPVEVQVVKGDVEVKVENKNLLDISKLSMMASNTRLTTGENHIPVLPNTTYVFSVKNATGIDGNIALYDENDNNTSNYAQGSVHPSTCTFTTGANDSYLKIARWYVGTTFTSIEAIEPQLEIGATQTPYTPHKEQKLPLTLGNIELCKIGDYKDYFYKSGSKWYLYKEIGKIIVDGTENWNATNRIDNTTKFFVLTLSNRTSILSTQPTTGELCNKLIQNNPYTLIGNYFWIYDNGSISVLRIGLEDDDITTAQQIKIWLSNNNLTVYYPLKNPTDIEITDTTLINQLEAINNAISYYEQTNISGTSSGISPLFDVEAYQSTKLLLEDIINSN